MSLLLGPSRREFQGMTPEQLIVERRSGGAGVGSSAVSITEAKAMRHSAVWACLRLRADLVSTFPVTAYRKVEGYDMEVSKPPILIDPGGERWDYCDWMYASQVDFDRSGNIIGLITERNSLGLPARIDLQSITNCTVRESKKDGLMYRINGKEYTPDKVWHEKQYPVAGLPVGLSPTAHAAWTISEGLTMQQFALQWFGNGAVPKARMKNTARKLKPQEISDAKQWYRDVMQHGDLLVTGADWEYDFVQSQESDISWIEGRRFGLADIARFYGCPADLIEAAVSAGGAITYATITQRNLQFLIMNLGPTVIRREKNLSKLLPKPRYVKMTTDALLRMDPETRAKIIAAQIESRVLTNSAARKLNNDFPLTDAEKQEFVDIYGPPKTSVGPSPAATPPPKQNGGPA